MALAAIGLLVLSVEQKICLAVVKLLLVQINNPGIAPFMVGVTASAVGVVESAMKAASLLHVGSHFFVARHAQTILRFPIELHVALLAVVLQFDVALNQFPRSHDGLNVLSADPLRKEQQHPSQCRPEPEAPTWHMECRAESVHGAPVLVGVYRYHVNDGTDN